MLIDDCSSCSTLVHLGLLKQRLCLFASHLTGEIKTRILCIAAFAKLSTSPSSTKLKPLSTAENILTFSAVAILGPDERHIL